MIDYYEMLKDYSGAIKTADEIIKKYESEKDYVCGVLYAKGLILAHDLDQPEEAAETFNQIIRQYPENGLAELAENELLIMGKAVAKKTSSEGKIVNNKVEINNYPNPFNPTTTIKYTIPEDGIVTIKVFDILGREIHTLVNQRQLKGDYSVEFDASGLASGMYIYQIRANDYVMSKKMVLLR